MYRKLARLGSEGSTSVGHNEVMVRTPLDWPCPEGQLQKVLCFLRNPRTCLESGVELTVRNSGGATTRFENLPSPFVKVFAR